jgi:hypothetical protein
MFLTGCGTAFRWVHYPPKTQQEYNSDFYDCGTLAKQNTMNSGYGGNIFVEINNFYRCMEQKYGYVKEKINQ